MILAQRRGRALLGDFLLPGDCHGLALAGAGIGMRPLAANRKPTPMPQAAVASKVHQPLDVHRHFTPEITLHAIIPINQLTDAKHLLIGKLVDPTLIRDAKLLTYLGGLRGADAIDVAKPDRHSLVGRDIHAGNTRHARLSCRPATGRALPP